MTNVTNEKMELLVEGTEYRDMCKKAKELGIPYSGVKKDVLFTTINTQIDKINKGEIDVPEVEVETVPVQEGETSTNEGTPTTATQGARRERTVRQAAKKWFEEEGAFPYNEGDVVIIVGGKDLKDRKLQITGPSAKKDMVKGQLIHPITGGLQNTTIAIAFDRLELDATAGEIDSDEPTAAQDNTEAEAASEVNENITEDAQEEVTIPELNNEEDQKEEAQ